MVIAPTKAPARSIEERLSALGIRSPIDPEIDPEIGPEAATRWRDAPRLAGLDGKVGGFLGNRKANAEVLLRDVQQIMAQRFGPAAGIALDKFIYSRPASDDIIDSLVDRCDFVVTAIAD